MRKFVLTPYSRKDQALEEALQTPERKQLYEDDLAAIMGKDPNLAIRCFEALASRSPNVKYFNIHAAQANLLLMQKIGWDVGYIGRARRFIDRAKRIDAFDRRIAVFEKAYKKIEEQAET